MLTALSRSLSRAANHLAHALGVMFCAAGWILLVALFVGGLVLLVTSIVTDPARQSIPGEESIWKGCLHSMEGVGDPWQRMR